MNPILLSGSTEATNEMTEFLSQLTEFSTWSFTQLGSVWTFVQANPVLVGFLAMTFIGFIVGLWHRFAR